MPDRCSVKFTINQKILQGLMVIFKTFGKYLSHFLQKVLVRLINEVIPMNRINEVHNLRLVIFEQLGIILQHIACV